MGWNGEHSEGQVSVERVATLDSGSLVQKAIRKRGLGWGSPFVIRLETWFLIRVVQGLLAISGNILVVTPAERGLLWQWKEAW